MVVVVKHAHFVTTDILYFIPRTLMLIYKTFAYRVFHVQTSESTELITARLQVAVATITMNSKATSGPSNLSPADKVPIYEHSEFTMK